MPLTYEQLKGLIGFVAETTDDEITCIECLVGMAELAEFQLAGREIDDAVAVIRDHVEFCPECAEEYEVLLGALEAIGDVEDEPAVATD